MKLEKFFAGVLAAAMMLTVGATAAFATTPAVTYPDQSEVKIYKHYGLEGNGTSPEETFYLVQADKTVLTGDISAEDVPNLVELTTKPTGAGGYYVASVKFDIVFFLTKSCLFFLLLFVIVFAGRSGRRCCCGVCGSIRLFRCSRLVHLILVTFVIIVISDKAVKLFVL